jgi:hypothetical protein
MKLYEVNMKIIGVRKITNFVGNRYDIEIENTHCYYANGILVHNCKSDGLRVSVHVKEDEVVIYSRAGNILDLHGRFDALIGTACVGRVFDAELMVLKADGKFEDRKTGNGILNSLNSNKLNRMKDDLCTLQMKLQELKRESEDFQIT